MLRLLSVVGLSSLASLTLCTALPAADQPPRVDFRRDVAPILQQHCIDCHGPELQMAELRLDERRHALADGDARGLIKAGHSGESLLIQRLVDRKLGIIMPPTITFFPSEKPGLPEDKLKILKTWIDQGADWPEDVKLASTAKAGDENPRAAALFAAIRAPDAKQVAALAAYKSLLESTNGYGSTPLLEAAAYADASIITLLIEQGADVNAANPDGATPLMRAAGNLKKTRLLIERGANVNAKSIFGRTALLIAATYPGNSATVRLLLDKGADIKDVDQFGETCLTSAAKRGDAEMVKLLIEAGADLAAGGRPPLVWAAEEGNVATLQVLLDHGAGKNPIHATMALGSAAARGPAEAVRLLLAAGGNPSAPSPMDDFTALHWAAYSDNVDLETVKLLLDKGGDVAAKSKSGQTPLDVAKKHGQTAIVALLDKSVEQVKPTKPAGAATELVAEEQIKSAAQKALTLLESCGPKFFAQSGCVACHQQTVTSLAAAEARIRGFHVDERLAREQVQMTLLMLKTFREKFWQRVDNPAGSAPSVGYLSLGLAAEGHPPDETTDAMIVELAGRQHADGSWTAFGHRPPIEYSRIVATALALKALQTYGPPPLKSQLDGRIRRAGQWLVASEPASITEHNFRLLGLTWAGADNKLAAAQAQELLGQQRPDGGWSQLPTLESDAYATGLTLWMLGITDRLSTTDAVYRRGVEFLVRTQQSDSSWHVASRSFPFQPYFESGFPHGHDQWISAMGTGYAAAALMRTVPVVKK
jgi:ankyrin repeat protein